MAAKGLLLRLKDYQVKASAAEKNAVTIILNHPDMVIGKSIHEFADLAYASPATIIRLCRKLGCAGYRDFQHALVYENALFKDLPFSLWVSSRAKFANCSSLQCWRKSRSESFR